MKDEAMIVLVVVEWLENSKRTQSDSIPSPLWNQKQQQKNHTLSDRHEFLPHTLDERFENNYNNSNNNSMCATKTDSRNRNRMERK